MVNLEKVTLRKICLELDGLALLNDISFNVRSGEILVTYGPNGSGKSLINRVLGLLFTPQKGSIFWNDEEIFRDSMFLRPPENYRRKIGFVWQKPVFLTGNVARNVEMPLTMQGVPREERRKRVHQLAKDFGIVNLLNQNPKKLSGGEMQKVSFMRAVIHDPELLILDEPTASLDPASILWFEEKILEKKRDGNPIVFTTHDLQQARRLGDKIAIVIDSRLAEYGDLESVLAHPKNNLAKAYLQGDLKQMVSSELYDSK